MWISLLTLLVAFNASADTVRTPHVTAEIVTEESQVAPGSSGWIGVRLEMIPHWHTYWKFPGDSGLPTKVQWQLPAGWSISAPAWEIPQRIELPPLVNFGYSGETILGFQIQVPPGTAPGGYNLTAKASWLVCKEECVPEKAELHFSLKVADGNPAKTSLANAFDQLRAQQPKSIPSGKKIAVIQEENRVGLDFGADTKWLGSSLDFFPLESGVVDGKAPPVKENGIYWLDKAEPFSAKAAGLRGELLMGPRGKRIAIAIDEKFPGVNGPAPTTEEAPALWLAIAFAFLGGVLLNLMPCVFPVLGIKVMALLEQGATNPWRARLHGKIYALGVVVSFWILTAVLLALRSAGEAVGWGFQLQQPAFVIALSFLFLGLAGNLGGFFEVGGHWMGFGSRLAEKEGWSGSFFTGVLAVVVATPCSAPFMGSAIGLVLSQPAWAIFSVFTGLAVGLAAPFVLLAYWPALLRSMPRPGIWMVRMKEFFAFPMLATMVWLLWVLGQQLGLNAVIFTSLGLLLMSFAAWVQLSFHSRPAKLIAFLLAITALGVGFLPLKQGMAAGGSLAENSSWKKYSNANLEALLRDGRPVFVDFTAAWCLTCQVNKSLVLDRAALQDFFRERGVTLLLADWTNQDQEITAALARHGRIGVPLYLAFPKGSKQPKILPQILTDDIVRKAF
ncbi:MAG: protein-disulfide reductase DsbD family protein [Bacteriovoracia bacterium]